MKSIKNGGGCISTDCSTLQLENLLSLSGFIEKKMDIYLQKNKKKNAFTTYTGNYLNCKKYRMANHEANFPMADERLISIKYTSIMISFRRRVSPLFHLNIIDRFTLVSVFES